jgi:hypothetical protein
MAGDRLIIKTKSIVYSALFWWLPLALMCQAQAPSQPLAATQSAVPRHKVQVSDPVSARQLAARGARLIANYGGFQLYDADQAAVASLGGKAEVRQSYNTIQLNAAPLDTSRPEIQSLRKSAAPFAGKRMHLIHFAGPVQPAWRESLLKAGAQIVSYIPQNAYLIYGDSSAIGQIQSLAAQAPHIQWEGPYLDDYKIHPAARGVDAKGNARQIGTDSFAIQMVADAAANAETLKLLDGLKLEPLRRQHFALHYLNVVGRFAADKLARIAAQPDVVSILPYFTPRKLDERQDQILAGNLSGGVPSGTGYLAWLAARGFTQAQFNASGFAVDVSDSGIDDGTTSPNHFGFYVNGQITNGVSRVIYNRLEGTPNRDSTLKGCDGHGTINSHILAGYDNRANFPFSDSSGYHYGLGVCPFVRLGSSVVFDPDNFTSPDYPTLQSAAYRSGARISNNSWGGSDGVYDSDAQEYDALVRDADSSTQGNQEMVIVFAAGNDGNNGVTSPATAKNVIAVGASDGVQPFGGSDGCGTTDADASNANNVPSFSGQGPCDDGRHKPDIMAPGTHISGGVIQAAHPGADGTADPCFFSDASGVCGGLGTNLLYPAGQEFYTASTGTSHSTPAVAGGCALLRQYFINKGWTPPSAAMTKAILMNSARYLNGSGANDSLWSDSQGMGEMDLGMAFDGAARILEDQLAGDIFTASGQTRTFAGAVADTTKPFRVTLAWTDAPGSTTGSAANNDLDLTVTIGGNTYKGNVFNGAFSTAGGSADTLDNVESVFLPAGVSGSFTATVTAASINSVGVPGGNGAPNQDFALVVYNANGVGITSASLAAESCSPTNGVIDPGETVTVDFALQNGGTFNTTNLVATLLSGGGINSPDGPKTLGVLTAGGPAVTTPFTFTADGTCGGTITASLALKDGSNSLGTATYDFQLGQLAQTAILPENFDAVTAPALPNNWTTDATGGQKTWFTESTSGTADSAPNAAFCAASLNRGVGELISPVLAITGPAAQLRFRQNYNLEASSATSVAYDGGVLEIQIGSAAFTDVLAAGGSFLSGGYNLTITSGEQPVTDNNPLAGRAAWSGISGPYGTNSYITTILQLPATAAGQNVQFKWRCGTDQGNQLGSVGWWVDTIVVYDGIYSCCSGAEVALPEILSPANGLQTTSNTVQVSGEAVAGLLLTLYDNSASNTSLVVGSNGFFSVQAALAYGANVLTAVQVQSGTNLSSGAVSVLLGPPAPKLSAPSNSPPSVRFTESGLAGAIVNLYDGAPSDGTLIATFANDSSGDFSGAVTLADGAYSFIATETVDGVTSLPSSAIPVNVLTVPPPTILSPVSGLVTNNPSLTVSGTGIAKAPITIYSGANVLATTNVNNSGNFTAAVKLAAGAQSLSAVQTKSGVASAPSAAVVVSWIVPAPVILSPASGLVSTNPSLTVSGTGVAGATVAIDDGAKSILSTTVKSAATFTATLKLADGTHSLTAVQTVSGLAGPPSAPVLIWLTLAPVIQVEPQDQTMFLKGNVTFTSGATGAAPLKYFWEKNGAKIAGAASTTLTLTGITAASAATYSMVATNSYGAATTTPATLTLIPNPFTNLTGNYCGLFSESPARFQSSGQFTLSLTALGAYSGKILNAGGSYSFSGAFSPAGHALQSVSRGSGKTPLVLQLALDVTSGTEQILGAVSNSNWVAALQADRAIYTVKNPAPEQGSYTMLFDTQSDGGASPGGDGYAKVTVTSAGMVSLSGVLSDNATVPPPAAVSVSKYGQWPLYLPLYGTAGSLSGWVDFTNVPGLSFEGGAAWFRTNSSGKLYPHGFTNYPSIIGSTFSPGGARAPALAFTNLQITLSGGGLPVPLTNNVTLSLSGKFLTNGPGVPKLTLSLVPSTGLISGSFSDPVTRLSTTIKGIVFQQQTTAGGFFLGTNATGAFGLGVP